jgi:hypothetical protein
MIVEAGGVAAIVAAVRCHADAAEHACATLTKLAGVKTNRVVITAAGGVDAVVLALRKHKDADRVQDHGNRALRELLGSRAVSLASVWRDAPVIVPALILDARCAGLHRLSSRLAGCS